MLDSKSLSVAEVIRQRRTIHLFRPEVPPFEVIREAVGLACWAPNHHVTEPWRFTHLGPQTAAAVVDLNARLVALKTSEAAGEAKRKQWSTVPGWLVVSCLRSDDPTRETEDYAACCCAIQNFSLALWSQGIGVKWTTGKVTRDPEFLRLTGIDPAQQRVVGMLWYGYPAEVPTQQRQPIDSVLLQRP